MAVILDGNTLSEHIQYLRRQNTLLHKKIAGLPTGETSTTTTTYQEGANISITNLPVKDEDNMASNSDVYLATQQSIKTYADTKLPLAGGAISGAITTSSTFDGRDVGADGIKLDGIAAGAEVNVQSDWNSSSGDNQILNKPTIAYTSAISNATTSASGLMSTADKTKLDGLGGSSGEANVQADWDETGTSDDAFIKNKPELGELDLSAFFAEFTYGSGLLTKIEYWNSSSKNTKYYTKDLTYTSGTLTQSVLTNNVSSATETKVLAYDNSGNLTTITKS